MVTQDAMISDQKYFEKNLSGVYWIKRFFLWYVLLIAQILHFGQTRRTGDRYIEHPMAVANLVREMGLGVLAQAAALLHDVIEENKGLRRFIAVLLVLSCGPIVAFMVFALTKWSKKTTEGEYFQKIKRCSRWYSDIAVIKLADKYTCIRTPLLRSKEKEEEFLFTLIDDGDFVDLIDTCRPYLLEAKRPKYDILWSFIQNEARSRLSELRKREHVA